MKPSRATSALAHLMKPLMAVLAGVSPDSPARVPGTKRISRRAPIALTAAIIAVAALAPHASTSLSFQTDLLVDGPVNAVAHELGDFDEDGVPDVLTSNTNGTVTLMLGRGDGWFDMEAPVAVGGNNQNLVTGDFNNDTQLDAAVVSFTTNNVTVLLGDGAGGLSSSGSFATGSQPFDLATADFDTDGNLDLVTANQNGNNVSILLGDGSGGFAAATSYAAGALPRGVAVGDVTGDGELDVIVANTDGNTITLLAGDGDGGFGVPLPPYLSAYVTARGPRKVALGDYNGDGRLDIATADSGDNSLGNPALRDNRTTVLLNSPLSGLAPAAGSPFITGPAQSSPFAIVASDIDGDGHLDLVTANRFGDNLSVLLGDGDGNFAAPFFATYTDFTGAVITDAAVGDVNGDGSPDLIGNVVSTPGFLVVFRNSTTVDPPTVLATTPASPANAGNPAVSGTVNGDTQTVTLYTTSDCSGAPAGLGTGAQFEGAGITVAVPPDQTLTFYATTTNAAGWATSSCSTTSVTFTNDATPPGAPSIASSSPASPANDNSPELLGAAETGSTVNLYASADCTGSPAATGSAADFGSPGLTVNVSEDSSTTFTATATDAAGNTSACSSGFTYTEDSTPPSTPSIDDSSPPSPSGDTSPELLGTAEADSTVTLYASADCSGIPAATGTAADFNSPGLTVSVANNSDTDFTATATDAAGNTSGCSSPFTYTACTANAAVTSTADDGPGTLREAIVNACGADSITFDIAGSGPHTIVLESELYLDKDLTITGPSDERIVISGGGTTTILAVDFFATVTLDRLNFENAFGDFEGGAIENFGVLTVRNSSITGSTGVIGAAICNEGTATVEFTTISGNTALDAGGGIYNAGTLTVQNSTVSGNISPGPGGGVLTDFFSLTSITNSTISGNTTEDQGGGVANGPEAVMSLVHVTITANHADHEGGGTVNYGDLTVTNSVIAGNTATDSDDDHVENARHDD